MIRQATDILLNNVKFTINNFPNSLPEVTKARELLTEQSLSLSSISQAINNLNRADDIFNNLPSSDMVNKEKINIIVTRVYALKQLSHLSRQNHLIPSTIHKNEFYNVHSLIEKEMEKMLALNLNYAQLSKDLELSMLYLVENYLHSALFHNHIKACKFEDSVKYVPVHNSQLQYNLMNVQKILNSYRNSTESNSQIYNSLTFLINLSGDKVQADINSIEQMDTSNELIKICATELDYYCKLSSMPAGYTSKTVINKLSMNMENLERKAMSSNPDYTLKKQRLILQEYIAGLVSYAQILLTIVPADPDELFIPNFLISSSYIHYSYHSMYANKTVFDKLKSNDHFKIKSKEIKEKAQRALQQALKLNRQLYSEKDNPSAFLIIRLLAIVYCELRDYLYTTGLIQSLEDDILRWYGEHSLERLELLYIKFEFQKRIRSKKEFEVTSRQIANILTILNKVK